MEKRSQPPEDPATVTRHLRDNAVATVPEEHELRPTADLPNVACGIMELGFPEATATLVALADGSTSLYFSNGGGVIGAGEHPAVQHAATDFLVAAERILDRMEPAPDRDYPTPGRARFYVRTYDELLSTDVDGDMLTAGDHPRSELFFSGHALIAAVREAAALGSGERAED